MSAKKTLAILVGGGPAPGINAVLAAATIEARNHGLRVLGCYDGFKWLVQGDTQHVVDIEINDTSRIHFDGGSIIRTSRTNPSKSAEAIRQVGEALQRLGVNHLITIGGDDTAYSASRLANTVPGLTVAHVPKTIDNDLPLPGDIVTFGFTTACNLGKELVRNLMQDAQTTERWFFVTVMGRHAGHLALGIGGSAGATVTLIAEEFPEAQISLDRLAEELDPKTLGAVERDAYGNVRLAELDLGRLLKERVSASLKARGVDVTIVAKEMGYELRCAPPGAHDIQYCRSLGYWAVRFLLEGGSNAMVTIQAGRLVPVPFGLMMDPKTGRIRVRYADVESEMYQTLMAYMIRLKPEDFEKAETVAALAKAGNLDPAEFTRRFSRVVGRA